MVDVFLGHSVDNKTAKAKLTPFIVVMINSLGATVSMVGQQQVHE